METWGRRIWNAVQMGWIQRITELSPHRAVVISVALAMWIGIGGLTASTASETLPTSGSGFGEVHWYHAD